MTAVLFYTFMFSMGAIVIGLIAFKFISMFMEWLFALINKILK